MTETAFICPTFEHFDYARRACRSFLKYTPKGLALLIDDASPSFHKQNIADWKSEFGDKLVIHRFDKNDGLTRSWNLGLKMAKDKNCKYAIAGNSDILFCEGWQESLVAGLDKGYALVGPLSNAPGVTARGKQEIGRYIRDYHLTDDPEYLNKLSKRLRDNFSKRFIHSPINGFFQFSTVHNWWKYAFSPQNDLVYDPKHKMVNNEDKLQGRWRKMGAESAICCGSFVFHYRAVTRGRKYVRGRWFRMTNRKKGV